MRWLRCHTQRLNLLTEQHATYGTVGMRTRLQRQASFADYKKTNGEHTLHVCFHVGRNCSGCLLCILHRSNLRFRRGDGLEDSVLNL